MIHQDDLVQVSWQCVHFLARDEVDRLGVPAMTEGRLIRAEVDGTALTTERGLFDALSAALQFPSYFGMNWDALDECLRDMEWLPAKGYVLYVYEADHLWRDAPHLAGKLVMSWLFAAESWSHHAVSFHLVFVL